MLTIQQYMKIQTLNEFSSSQFSSSFTKFLLQIHTLGRIFPYVWYIWQTLSLPIWDEKQIGGYLVWRISSFIVRIN